MASDIAYLTFQVTTWSGKCSFSEERVLFCHPSSFLLGTSIGETWAFGGDALSSNLQWFYVTKSGAKLAIARFLGLKLRYRRLANLCSPYACEFWGRKHYRDSPLAGNEYIQPYRERCRRHFGSPGFIKRYHRQATWLSDVGHGSNGCKVYKVSIELGRNRPLLVL